MANRNRLSSWWYVLGMFGYCMAVQAEVYSLNAVGVISVPLQAGEPALVAVQLVPVGASGTVFTVSQVFGTNTVVSGTQVKRYDADAGTYVTETFASGGWTPGTNVVQRGESVWICSPSNCTLKVSGYVPGSSETNTTMQASAGMQLMGCPYPVDSVYTNHFSGDGAPGDLIIPVAGDGQLSGDAIPAAYYEGTGWQPAGGHFSVAAGWWYRSSTNRSWQVTKPYDYP